jgi:hypothetical protein
VWLGLKTTSDAAFVVWFGLASAILAPTGIAMIGYAITGGQREVLQRLSKVPEIDKLISEAKTQEERIRLLEELAGSNRAPSVQKPRRKRPGRLLADLRRVRCPHGWLSRSAPDILRTRTAHSLGSAGVPNNLSLRRMKLPKEPRMSLRQWCSPRQRLLRTTSRHSRATPFHMLIVARTEQPL